ncbi:MAG: nitronate monooxygenase [Peptococcaceae bacterium]|nr:nitronate monooxygenase [Peptococcaceae bacterium]
MEVPQLIIGGKKALVPIVQGAMGVGVSLSGLAGAVAKAGGIGVIAGVEIGFQWPTYADDKLQANSEALLWHLKKAREIAPQGVIGVNIMVAVNNYAELVATAIQGGADIIFSGAGLPLSLPALALGSTVAIVPIVSSAKAAVLITKHYLAKHHRLPDALVIEGPLAGGHLGFSRSQLADLTGKYSLENILTEVLVAMQELLGEEASRVPLIAGGGLYTGGDIARMLKLGAGGVQIASRFVATVECDAALEFKQAYVDATLDDIVIIDSPVGMPGRALRNAFLGEVTRGLRQPDTCSVHCLKPCNPLKAPYCIALALIAAARGELADGFAFCGAEVHRIDKIVSVAELMQELLAELREA